MEKKSLKLKPTMKMLPFQLSFVSEVFLIDLIILSLVSVHYNSINKSNILNKHLMAKNNIK